jgi:hypothetical protein
MEPAALYFARFGCSLIPKGSCRSPLQFVYSIPPTSRDRRTIPKRWSNRDVRAATGERGRIFLVGRRVPAHAPGARLIGAGGRSKREGCRCLARSPAGCPGRWRQELQTNPPKEETLGCPCGSCPGLKGSVQCEKESLGETLWQQCFFVSDGG